MASKLILAVLTMAAVLAAPHVRAQNATTPASNVTAKQHKPAPRPAAPKVPASKPAAKHTPIQLDSAHRANNTHAAAKETPRAKPSELGRIPLESGSFGISTDTKMKMYQTPDGNRIRGLDGAMTSTREPTYFGLSLSVPTTGSTDSSHSGLPPPRN
ncbi:MAG: hypothetical protein AB1490_22135 [Pseudomonadota bacterium]